MNFYSPNPYPIITCIGIIFFLIIPCVLTLSFNYTTFSPIDHNVKIRYENDAYPKNGVIQLAGKRGNSQELYNYGRAMYSEPLHLWDAASGNLADFATHFSFVINSLNSSFSAEGMAFFLAPNGSRIPPDALGGGLGLTYYYELTPTHKFVAVEFDIHNNVWDPLEDHVGIDINSLVSVTNKTWFSSIEDGKINEAWITYDSKSKNLSVVFTGFQGGNLPVKQDLSYIVDLRDHLPEMVTFGFTASTGFQTALHSIHSWDFNSTLEIKYNKTDPPVIKLVVGTLVLVVGLGLLLYFCRRTRERRDHKGNDTMYDLSEVERGSGPRKFSYRDLAKATKNFSDDEKLGEGGFGEVYKGYIQELNAHHAVKRISKGSKQGFKSYVSEVKIISGLRHRNLVQLIGWCHEKSKLLLVYELMPNGSLDHHLFKGRSLLTWDMRYKIAKGIASALLYLHDEWEQCVVHRDIKASNVMLDSSFNAKLGDFGLARLVDHEKGLQTTVPAGTMGYMAPESVITGKASKEADVYSFGVLALEIACGRKPIKRRAPEDEMYIVQWVWSLHGTGKLLEAADPKLSLNFTEKEIECLMIVGLWCAHPDYNARPSIKQASQVLIFEAPLPELPQRMPVPTYAIPLVTSLLSPSDNEVSENSQVMSSISART